MAEWRDDDKGKEDILKFAFLIKQIPNGEGKIYSIDSHNQGIPDGNVIMTVEAWLESSKEKFKGNINSPSTNKL